MAIRRWSQRIKIIATEVRYCIQHKINSDPLNIGSESFYTIDNTIINLDARPMQVPCDLRVINNRSCRIATRSPDTRPQGVKS